MGAAAITTRTRLARRIVHRDVAAGALSFDDLGGPVVSICGLAGGAGTSTLALLLARMVAGASAAPILLAEADPQRAGLAVLTGRTTPRPLVALAHELADQRTPTDTFVELEPGLRLIAAKPQAIRSADPDALGALLSQACEAHGLVIVDCGTDWTTDSAILVHATHIVWTVPATPLGLAAGHARLEIAPPPGRAREVLAATAIASQHRVSVRAVRKLARQRCEQLVLVAHDEALARGEQTVSDAVRRAIAAMAPTLRRQP